MPRPTLAREPARSAPDSEPTLPVTVRDMKIVADDNIPAVREWCGAFGDIETVDGRRLHRDQLRDADVLLIRSVTRADATLLAGTPVRFLGSATSGVDHIDFAYLEARGIAFGAAPGCNARAVAEYVLACCLAHVAAGGPPLSTLTLGIVGCGQVGSAVRRLMEGLGVTCLVSDPPRAAREPGFVERPLAEVLRADVVTLHVPLTGYGDYPTRGLIAAPELATLRQGTLLINAARGGVLVEADWLAAATPPRLVLDCWEGEPHIRPAALARTWLASPHIAGHTVDARLRATAMLAARLGAFLGTALPRVPPCADALPLSYRELAPATWQTLVLACCDPRAYTTRLRAAMQTAPAGAFDRIRRELGVRREFAAQTICEVPADDSTREVLRALGFTLAA